jgi:hypothetical protein
MQKTDNVFELYLYYYSNSSMIKNKAYPTDIVLLDTRFQFYYTWLPRNTTSHWLSINRISLHGYIKGSPLLFLILTGKDYYTTLPKMSPILNKTNKE